MKYEEIKRAGKVFTAEYVSPMHPDKMCDRISDVVKEAFLKEDPESRTAVEVLGGHGLVVISGEVTSRGSLGQAQYEQIVSQVTGKSHYQVLVNIAKQSSEIAQGVDAGGAGDQGVVIGYACDHNEELLPQEFFLAKSLCNFLYDKYPFDGKTQITIDEKHSITHLVASFQNTSTAELTVSVKNWLKTMELSAEAFTQLINPAGEWSTGGFEADTGLTGRKIVIDQYGPRVPVGGGAFSGKDWTKVDQSGARYARHIAKKLLKQSKAREVRIELAYAIGVADPVHALAYIDSTPTLLTDFDCSMNGIKEFITN